MTQVTQTIYAQRSRIGLIEINVTKARGGYQLTIYDKKKDVEVFSGVSQGEFEQVHETAVNLVVEYLAK